MIPIDRKVDDWLSDMFHYEGFRKEVLNTHIYILKQQQEKYVEKVVKFQLLGEKYLSNWKLFESYNMPEDAEKFRHKWSTSLRLSGRCKDRVVFIGEKIKELEDLLED